jgi:hypothetical protein
MIRKEKVAMWFKERKFLGRCLETVLNEGVFVSPPIVSCFGDYELTCRLCEGKTGIASGCVFHLLQYVHNN